MRPEMRDQETQTEEEYLVRVSRPPVQFRLMKEVIFFEPGDDGAQRRRRDSTRN